MGEQDNIKTGAREVADLLKDGKTAEAGERLKDDFKNMTTEDFRQFVKQVDAFNADDRKANASLPDLEFNEISMNKTDVISKVDITTPGKVFGNMWRNSETVVDCRGGDGMIAHLDGVVQGRNAQLNQVLESMDRTSNQQANKPVEQRKGN